MEASPPTDQHEENRLGRLIAELGLKQGEDDLFIGKVRGFPIGLKLIDPGESMMLLIQIRYPVDAEAKSISGFGYGPEVEALVREKKLEISVEDKIAWLTFGDAASTIEHGIVPQVVDSVLAAFEKAGLAGLQSKCHYCQENEVEVLTCAKGKVAQICYACLEKKVEKQAVELNAKPDAVSRALLQGCVASLAGAVAWALIWIGHDYLFDFLGTKQIVVPHIFLLIVFVIVGFLVGGPVGYVLKRIPNRGHILAGAMGIIFAVAAILIGEIFFVSWLIYHEVGVISFSAAVRILPHFWADTFGFYLVHKILAAAVCVLVAYDMAKPKEPGLKL